MFIRCLFVFLLLSNKRLDKRGSNVKTILVVTKCYLFKNVQILQKKIRANLRMFKNDD